MNTKVLRAKPMADYLGVGLSTIWLYAKQGKLTPHKISAKVTVFSVDEANKLLGLDVEVGA